MKNLISFENFALTASTPITKELLDLNEETIQYGLKLTEEDAKFLSDVRNQALKDNERIEVGVGAAEKIIKTFAKSRYINQSEYVQTIEEIISLFYYMKTECHDAICDDDLINELFVRFELYARGDVDTLVSRYAEKIIRAVNDGHFVPNDPYSTLDEDDDGRATPKQLILNEYENENTSNNEEMDTMFGQKYTAETDPYYDDRFDITAELGAFDEFIDNLAVDDDISEYLAALEEDDNSSDEPENNQGTSSDFGFDFDDYKKGDK